MGLIKAFASATSGVLADQWKEYYYCNSLDTDIIVKKADKRMSKGTSNTHGNENIIANGSVIAVADGQCMLIVEQGRIVDVCAEPGEYVFDSSTEPSIFAGKLDEELIISVFKNIGTRFGFGGDVATTHCIYYFNTKEFIGNYYGTPAPIPFRVVDNNIGLDLDITIKCFGEYSYRITNPLLFYVNVCGNIESTYLRENIDGQLKSELLTSLQPAFAEISNLGIRYSALPGHTVELADSLNRILSDKWKNSRGVEISSLGISSVKANEKDEDIIKDLQRNATFRDPAMAAAQLVNAQSIAMQEAAKNNNAGPAMAFMGMNMANQIGGIDAQSLFKMANTEKTTSESKTNSDNWKCKCGNLSNGLFCSSCGAKKTESVVNYWLCTCGTRNNGKFCSQCGLKQPNANTIQCDSCGWKTISNETIKFCPECGKPLL